jgi:hypothetical protein
MNYNPNKYYYKLPLLNNRLNLKRRSRTNDLSVAWNWGCDLNPASSNQGNDAVI